VRAQDTKRRVVDFEIGGKHLVHRRHASCTLADTCTLADRSKGTPYIGTQHPGRLGVRIKGMSAARRADEAGKAQRESTQISTNIEHCTASTHQRREEIHFALTVPTNDVEALAH